MKLVVNSIANNKFKVIKVKRLKVKGLVRVKVFKVKSKQIIIIEQNLMVIKPFLSYNDTLLLTFLKLLQSSEALRVYKSTS